jgi:cysteine desulfuration protein SufE
MPLTSCLKKQEDVKKLFCLCLSQEEKYQKIIELGRSAPLYPLEFKIEEYIVPGCQSTLYLRSFDQGDKLFFESHSDALISSGLAALLILTYSGESPEAILKCPPLFIEELGISSALSLTRSNGLAHIFLRMKQDALKHLVRT